MDGGTQKFFALKKIRELNIFVPPENEQLQIGGFLEKLDCFITLHQQKLDKYALIKKAMMSELITGKIKLV